MIADVHEVDAEEDVVVLALLDVRLDQALGQLVGDQDRRHDKARAGPRLLCAHP